MGEEKRSTPMSQQVHSDMPANTKQTAIAVQVGRDKTEQSIAKLPRLKIVKAVAANPARRWGKSTPPNNSVTAKTGMAATSTANSDRTREPNFPRMMSRSRSFVTKRKSSVRFAFSSVIAPPKYKGVKISTKKACVNTNA